MSTAKVRLCQIAGMKQLDKLDTRFGAGRATLRTEDQRLLTGKGQFADDFNLPDQAWLAVLRSPHAHAKIIDVEAGAARALPGIFDVITGAELLGAGVGPLPTLPLFTREDGSPMAYPPRYVIAHDVVRFPGEIVAAVIAETRSDALEALEAIDVEYEPLPSVSSAGDAIKPGALQLWPAATGNVAATAKYGDGAKVEAAFAKAAKVVALDIHNQRLVPSALEPRASIAEYDPASERLTLHIGIQNPTATKTILADVILKTRPEKVRVLVSDIGGGFGMKAGLYPEDAIIAYAARKHRRPVKWRSDRSDEFLGGTHGRDLTTRAELALDATGRALALRLRSLANFGGTLSASGAVLSLALSPFVASGVYDIPLIDYRIDGVLTNTAPTGAYRGAGRPEAIYLIERLMDQGARALGLDPRDIRRRNMVPSSRFPFTNPMGQVYDSGEFARLMDLAAEAADWNGFAARRTVSEKRGLLRGRGLSTYIEWTGGRVHNETVTVTVHGNGRVLLHSATQAMGQGLATSYAQMIAAALEIPLESIDVLQGDTDLVAGFGSLGSRSMFVGGSAVAIGSNKTIDEGRHLAAEALEAAAADIEFAKARFTVAGTDKSIGLFELAGRQTGGKFAVTSETLVDGPSWPNGCHVCEVEIDPETGALTIDRYTTVDDVGTAINPMIVLGQIHGGIAQGIGQALIERTHYDPDSGQLLTGSFMDYGLPRADELPSFAVRLEPGIPCKTNPIGAKGAGESGTVGAPPAVINALLDALAAKGVHDFAMPASPERVWRALRDARKA